MDKELITKENVSNVGNIQISEETKALISCRAKLSDIYETVANVIGRLYGDTGFPIASMRLMNTY